MYNRLWNRWIILHFYFKAIGQRNVLEHTKAKHLPKKKVVRGDRGILKKRIRTVDGVLYGGSL